MGSEFQGTSSKASLILEMPWPIAILLIELTLFRNDVIFRHSESQEYTS